jgi:hypothetical protein
MTDSLAPGGAGSPNTQPDPDERERPGQLGAAAGSEPEGTATPAPPSGGQPAGRKGLLIVILVLVLPLAIILWAVKDNTSADDLKAGDCFDLPTAASVSTVTHHPCTEAHTAEVFHVAEFTGSDMDFPVSFVLSRFVSENCAPAFETYVGADIDSNPDLAVGYFHPNSDGWSSGDRTITCYITRADEGPMTESVKASGTS